MQKEQQCKQQAREMERLFQQGYLLLSRAFQGTETLNRQVLLQGLRYKVGTLPAGSPALSYTRSNPWVLGWDGVDDPIAQTLSQPEAPWGKQPQLCSSTAPRATAQPGNLDS